MFSTKSTQVKKLIIVGRLYFIINKLYAHWINSTARLDKAGVTTNMTDVPAMLQHENLTAKQIANQTKLSYLVEKPVAENRVITSISSFRKLIELCVIDASLALEGDTRKNKTLLTNIFNSVIDEIDSECLHLLEWGLEGEVSLQPTKILAERIRRSQQETEALYQSTISDESLDVFKKDFDVFDENGDPVDPIDPSGDDTFS